MSSSPPVLPISNPVSSSSSSSSESSSQAPIATPAFKSFLNRLADSGRAALSQRRPWSEVLDRSAFSRPESLSEASSRLRKNLSYFRLNYLLLLGSVLGLSLLSHPLSLLLLLSLLSAWSFLYLFRPSDPPSSSSAAPSPTARPSPSSPSSPPSSSSSPPSAPSSSPLSCSVSPSSPPTAPLGFPRTSSWTTRSPPRLVSSPSSAAPPPLLPPLPLLLLLLLLLGSESRTRSVPCRAVPDLIIITHVISIVLHFTFTSFLSCFFNLFACY
ncbi:hypothetical protein Sjap_014235 [Stephania japonica]|uniref:PRA1 family protein n=1 Tax=Stephania japonica TaxID=461633 RepID=A0AAP0IZI4_9MAGN